MFYICEKDKDLQKIKETVKSCYIEIITSNDNFHPALAFPVAVYIRPLQSPEGYVVPLNHDEALNVSYESVQEILNSFEHIFVLNKKSCLYFFNFKKNCYDLTLKHSLEKFERLDSEVRNKTCDWYYNRYGGLDNINQIIPLSKLFERCEDRFSKIEKHINFSFPEGFDFYNEKVTKSFFLVEKSGLRVDEHSFIERFKPTNPDFSIKNEIAYNSYNLYNITSRPTNSFNGVNFLAIPKGQEFRRCFKPQNDEFVQLDFDGYHVRLVSKLVDFNLKSDEKAHIQLAKIRTGKNTFTKEEYVQAKADNFKMIYGNPDIKDAQVDFSKKIQKFISNTWKEFLENKYVKDIVSGRHFSSEIPDMYDKKLFNYLIQSLETSRNAEILFKVLRFLNKGSFKSKVVLITYDSFLLDTVKSEKDEILKEIQSIMEGTSHMFPVEIESSKDLNF